MPKDAKPAQMTTKVSVVTMVKYLVGTSGYRVRLFHHVKAISNNMPIPRHTSLYGPAHDTTNAWFQAKFTSTRPDTLRSVPTRSSSSEVGFYAVLSQTLELQRQRGYRKPDRETSLSKMPMATLTAGRTVHRAENQTRV